MPNRNSTRRLIAVLGLAIAIASIPACSVHQGHAHGSFSHSHWYEEVGIAFLAVGVFIIAACSGGHGSYHGHYGHGYHSGWHCR